MSCFEGFLEVSFLDDGFGEASRCHGCFPVPDRLSVLFPGFRKELVFYCHYPHSQISSYADVVGGGIRSITLETAS